MDSESGVSLRQVKLKVLYTFDTDHKNNHLARWPQSLEIQSVHLDEASIIGCIDLRTCLQAVTTASPELTSNIDNDYTVYAYDYSEPDTPLVGQGMLSKSLAQEGNIDVDNEAMVTGRITKSVMGLFSKSAQETLEVKLRLTPVSNSSFRRRSGSVSSNPDTVQSQWNSLSQTNGAFRPQSPMDTAGLEAMQRMLSEGAPPRDRMGSFHGDSVYSQNQNPSRPSSRAGTPSQTQHPNPPARQSSSQSRPASRVGTRTTGHARRDSFNSGYYSAEEVVEEGPARKRAKIQKVDHPSRSNLNIERQPDSLRVAASIASSVRIHRPVPLNPTVAMLHNSSLGDEPVRPPTPITAPTKTGRPRGRPRKVVSANLLRGPKPRASSPANQTQQQPPESSFSSPEDTRGESITSTPADLPSSPPVIPESQNLVTSPQLPPMMNEADSGFMSGCLEDLFGDEAQLLDFDDFIHDKPMDFEQMHEYQHNNYEISKAGADANTEGPMANLPAVFDEGNEIERSASVMEPPPPPPPTKASSVPAMPKANSFASHHRPIVAAPRLAPALAPKVIQPFDNRRARSFMPQVPASDPIRGGLQRSHTWAPEMSDAAMSDLVTSDEQAKVRPKKRVGKEQTKARLENAIASGEMPPFCDNCGAIETPAWRRAYTKVFESPWDELETSLEPGECCYKEPLERDAKGSIIKFKGYKSERRQDDKSADEGWLQICLCNPCGLWFHKSKFPRPPEKWQKKDANGKRKRKRHPKSQIRLNAPKPTLKSDAATPASDDSSPADTAAEGGDMEDNADGMTVQDDDANEENEPELPPMPHEIRGGSAEPANRGLKFNNGHQIKDCGRRVQSSPARIGNNRANAIEIDLTPKSTIRQLFPSPQSLKNKYNATAAKALSTASVHIPAFVRRSPRLHKVRDIFATPLESGILVTVGGSQKENVTPNGPHDDGLEGLFDVGFEELMPPPTTPKRRSERLLFKTPGRTPSREFGETMSPNVQRTPSASRTPRNMHSITTKAINDLQRNHSLAEMTPFSRSIHETLFCTDAPSPGPPQTPKTNGSGRSRKTPRKTTTEDSGNLFDFPDLPSLKGSSPMGVNLMQAFDFSEMTTEQMHPDFNDVFSTDLPMPSSPPQGFFDFVSGKDGRNSSVWAELEMQDDIHSEYPDLDDNETFDTGPHSGGLRRSPRKHAA